MGVARVGTGNSQRDACTDGRMGKETAAAVFPFRAIPLYPSRLAIGLRLGSREGKFSKGWVNKEGGKNNSRTEGGREGKFSISQREGTHPTGTLPIPGSNFTHPGPNFTHPQNASQGWVKFGQGRLFLCRDGQSFFGDGPIPEKLPSFSQSIPGSYRTL